MGFVTEDYVDANGHQFFIAQAGDPANPLVILLHGFPESWASWRYQLPVLAESGYHAVAPDLRGYGESYAPAEIDAYSQRALVQDVLGLIDATGHTDAIVVGHDWGAALAWQVARCYPDRVRALVALSVPYGGKPLERPADAMRRKFGDVFFYMLYFQTPGVAEQELGQDIRDSLRRVFHSWSAEGNQARVYAPRTSGGFLTNMDVPETPPHWMRDVELDFYVSRFEHSGFRGPLNWYRALDLYWEQTRDEPDAQWLIRVPTLFIAGQQDPILRVNSRAIARMPTLVPDLRGDARIEHCGHWTQMEQAAEVNRLLLDFIEAL